MELSGTINRSITLSGSMIARGLDGRGIVSIAKTGTSGLVDTYTITYTDETTSTFTVTNGANGQITATSFAEEFSSSKAYAAGDYVVYSGQLYQFTTAHAAGAWNASHATAVQIADQVSELKSAISQLTETKFRINTAGNTKYSLTTKNGYYTNYSGDYTANSGYNSYEIVGTEDSEIYFDSTGFGYLSLCVYNGVPSSSTIVGSRMREDTLPKSTNPYTLPSGYIAVISVANGDTLSFYSNYKNVELSEDIMLADSQIEQAKNAINDNSKIYITWAEDTNAIILSTYTQLTDTKKLRIDLYKHELNNINSNVWVMGGVYVTNNALSILNTVVLPVEWDCAIKETGASDFVGGKQHGNEVYESYSIFADGIPIDPTSSFTPFYADTLELVQESKLNRIGNSTDYIIQHIKHIVIKRKNVFCEQIFKALQTFSLNTGYTAMLATTPTYAPKFIRNGKCEIEDITDAGYTPNVTRGNDIWAVFFSDKAVIRFSANSDSNMTPTYGVSKGSNDYKSYYSINDNAESWENGKIITSNYSVDFEVSE